MKTNEEESKIDTERREEDEWDECGLWVRWRVREGEGVVWRTVENWSRWHCNRREWKDVIAFQKKLRVACLSKDKNTSFRRPYKRYSYVNKNNDYKSHEHNVCCHCCQRFVISHLITIGRLKFLKGNDVGSQKFWLYQGFQGPNYGRGPKGSKLISSKSSLQL